MNNIKTTFSPALQEATGKIEYGLTNDYMFRVLFQKNKKALTGLGCSLLHLNPGEITSIEITNPVEIGSSFSDKEFRLDIRLILNSHQQIDLEMQVNDYHDWPERSIAVCMTASNMVKSTLMQSRQSTSASSIIRLFQNILCSILKIRSWM